MATFRFPKAKDTLLKNLRHAGTVHVLDHFLARGGRPIIFAGSVRDVLMSVEWGVTSTLPRDVDIGIEGLSAEKFHHTCHALGAKKNRYGGYNLTRDVRIPVDLWRLEETWGLRTLKEPYSVKNVLRAFVIDLNAIAFDPTSESFHDLGSLDALHSRRIGLVRNALIHSAPTFAAKALLLSAKFSFSLKPSLSSFILRNLDRKTLSHESRKIYERPTPAREWNEISNLLHEGVPGGVLAGRLQSLLLQSHATH